MACLRIWARAVGEMKLQQLVHLQIRSAFSAERRRWTSMFMFVISRPGESAAVPRGLLLCSGVPYASPEGFAAVLRALSVSLLSVDGQVPPSCSPFPPPSSCLFCLEQKGS